MRAGLALWLDDRMTPIGDERVYLHNARNLWQHGVLETGAFVRPPLYFLYLAVNGALFGSDAWTLTARLGQCAAGVAAAVPVYRSALRVGGVRAARLAAAFLLFDPTLVAFSHLLWPETLFLLVVAIVFDGVALLDATHARRAVALGAATGVAMLLKPVFGLFTLVLAASWLRRLGWRACLHLVFVFGGAAAVVVAPWALRNQLRYGGAIVLENQGAYNLWNGNAEGSPADVLAEWRRIGDPSARNRAAATRGVAAIRDDPARFAARTVRRAANFFGLEYFAVRHLAMGGYGDVSRGALLAAFWILQAGWALALMSVAFGLGPVARDPTLRLVLIYGAAFVALVSAMTVTTRFRVPFAFVIAIASGVGVDRLLARRTGPRSALLALAAAAALALSASRPVFLQHITARFETRADLVDDDRVFFRY